MRKWMVLGAIVAAGALISGCGYTDLEMAAKQRQIDALVAQVHALEAVPAPACGVDAKRPPRATSRPVLSAR
jgi:outer membrane murein-binding lipoprotein Lpp